MVIGAGMSCTEDMAEAGMLLAQGRLRRLSPFFVPRILPNMAAGAVSIQHGLQVRVRWGIHLCEDNSKCLLRALRV